MDARAPPRARRKAELDGNGTLSLPRVLSYSERRLQAMGSTLIRRRQKGIHGSNRKRAAVSQIGRIDSHIDSGQRQTRQIYQRKLIMSKKTRTDRIDFLVLPGNKIRVTKMYRAPYPKRRDVVHDTQIHSLEDFDVDAAILWLKTNGFTVMSWPTHKKFPLGWRAWRGAPWPIRSGWEIGKLRQKLEQLASLNTYPHKYENSGTEPGWDYNSLHKTDLAFLAETRTKYTIGIDR